MAPPSVRGWCPSLFEPMGSGDGLLARVKPPLGRLSAQSARTLAAAARRWGNGRIELTNRAAVQVRGLSEATLPSFREAVLAEGLAHPDPAVERRRNLVLSPLASAAGATLAAALERWIAEETVLAALPSKFGFAVETEIGDIRLWPEDDRWRVALAGAATTGVTASPLAAIQAVTRQFLTLAAAYADPPRRMAELVRRCGADVLFLSAGMRPTGPGPALRGDRPIAGVIGDGSAFALGLDLGGASADDLDRGADLAERFGGGELRTSPWRALVLSRVAADAGAELAAAAQQAGFVVAADDPRLSIVACVGAPACASAHAPTRLDAQALAARPLSGRVHLSGCARGCAHPASADFTLVAAPDGYGLVRDGRAGDPPIERGLSPQGAARLLAAEPREIP